MSKAVATDKGGRAEEGLAAHFRSMGFFALRGLPFRHDEEDITDVDVWLYERGAGAERRRFIVDSKNKARPKLVERLFWTSGARDALGVDGAYVASAGIREATRRLAKRLRINVVDLQTVAIDETAVSQRLTREELSKLVGEADRNRDSKRWRTHLHDTLAALLTTFGGSSANVGLRSAGYFADQILTTASASPASQLATRAFYLSVSAAAIGLDYVVAQTAYQATDRQQQEVEDAVRYGSDHAETKRRLDLALQVARQYLPNGAAQANQLREKIASDTEAFLGDVIAEVALKMGCSGSLFDAARNLEMAAHLRYLPAYSSLSTEARSFCGAVMDFFELDRTQLAEVLESNASAEDLNSEAHHADTDEV
ncbi:hypothetical protein VXE32_005746 [Burkholderia cepacia]|nr:hypothetical protein [Burkholderia cepacia]